MADRRVVVTGLGLVTPMGIGREAVWEALRAERSRVGSITRFDASPFACRIGAEVQDFDPVTALGERRARRLDRCSQFAIAAARQALADAGADPATCDPDTTGVMMGTALGGVSHAEEQHIRYLQDGPRAVNPGLALTVFAGASSCNLAIEFGFSGPNATNGMSCASGAIAIGDAFRTIRRGEAEVMLAGGAEAPLAPLTFGAFALIRAMSTRNDAPDRACRPFDAARDGFVMGEGAAVLLLEERDRALARGARVYLEVLGYGQTNDAWHMTAPRPDARQSARAIRMALREAGLPPEAVEYVNAHGSSTPLNDSTETLALRDVFGPHADRLAVSGTKAYYGHALGASGAIEAAICALAARNNWLPPTLNLETPDPACDLDYLPGTGRSAEPEIILSTSFGFGGINAALLFGR